MNRSQRTLLLLGMVFVLPVAAAYLAYFFWRPATTVNYGELLYPTLKVTAFKVRGLHGEPLSMKVLEGKWSLLQVDSAGCAEVCRKKLFAMRQAHLAQGKKQERVQRVFLVDDGSIPSPVMIKEAKDWLWFGADGLLPLPAKISPRQHIYLIDPLGNIILRYPADPDIKGLLKDLERLLKASQIG